MGLEDVRARLKDRQTKDGALGTDEVTVCLDLALIGELEQLQADLADAVAAAPAATPGKARLAPASAEDSPEVAELRGQVEAKEQEVKAASLRLVFRSIGSSRYQEILNAHPDNQTEEGYADFLDALTDACLHEVWDGDERVKGLEWDEIRPELNYGEWDVTTTKVLALNRRKVNLPFSLRSSRQNRT